MAYWRDGSDARIFTYLGRNLYALDPKTGEPFPTFGDGGKVDLSVNGQYLWNAPPLVVRDLVVVGSSMPDQDSAAKMSGPVGEVRAYDVRTGTHRWTFRVIPGEGDPATKTWENESWRYTGAGNVWAPMSADDDLGYVYLPDDEPDQRHVRRPPAGQQPVQPTASCASTPRPASGSGISRRFTTTCATTTIPRRRFSRTSRWTGAASGRLSR